VAEEARYKVCRFTITWDVYFAGYDLLRGVYEVKEEKSEYTNEIPLDVVEKIKKYNVAPEHLDDAKLIMTADDVNQTLDITVVVDLHEVNEDEIDEKINKLIDNIVENGYDVLRLFKGFIDVATSVYESGEWYRTLAAYMHGGDVFGEVRMVVVYFG